MYSTVINFWFEELEPKQWFQKSDQLDLSICRRFGELHTQAIAGELHRWRETALGSLAELIVLDQFSRNIYRDKPESFAYDAIALVLAQCAVAKQYDAQLPTDQRVFLYMPYMHSESRAIHIEAVKLFESLGNESNLEYEYKHKAIIDKFGRYPHRNEILSRTSTAEERAFLKTPGSSF